MRVDSQPQRGPVFALCTVMLLSSVLVIGCTEDGVTLPDDYNTQRFREIVIDTQSPVSAEDNGTMRPLNGMHGSPIAIVPTDPDLSSFYWGRTAGSSMSGIGWHSSRVRHQWARRP